MNWPTAFVIVGVAAAVAAGLVFAPGATCVAVIAVCMWGPEINIG